MVFNSLVMLLSALYSFKLGRQLGFKFAFPLVIFVLFTPVYYRFSQSCLTEPLFGLVAISSAYFFLRERYILASILISFIIYSRSEGMLFIPIYAFALILRKQYKTIPFLLTGFLFYSFVGLFIGKGFLWYYYDYPYKAVVEIYGKGPFWHWFTNQKIITGTPFSIYITVSLFLMIVISLFNFKSIFNKHNTVLITLITVPTLIYMFGHSYLWYKGLSASIGLFRIVGGVIPLLAIIALYGTEKAVKFISNFDKTLPSHLVEQADEAMKDVYMLDMLGIAKPVLERELEQKMVAKIQDVMLELGYGFAFIGNQYRIVANEKEYFIDLLFSNRRLNSLVAIELKIGRFKPEYAGKMNFYLNLLDDFVREPGENPSSISVTSRARPMLRFSVQALWVARSMKPCGPTPVRRSSRKDVPMPSSAPVWKRHCAQRRSSVSCSAAR